MAQDNRQRINDLREILAAGVSSVQIDGTTVALDLDSLRRELSSLEAGQPETKHRRPRVLSINLSSAGADC